MTYWLRQLWVQVLIGMAAGIVVGAVWPGTAEQMQPFSDGFVALMKMIVAPVLFCTVVLGVGKVDSIGRVGRVGAKSLVYFIALTGLCMVVGLVIANVFQPGAGMHIDASSLSTEDLPEGAATAHLNLPDFILSIIPATMFSAFTEGEILPVMLVSVLFGIGVKAVGEPAAGLLRGVENLSKVVFKVVGWVMRTAPLGAFGGLALTVGKYGIGTLHQLLILIAIFSVTCLLFILVVFGGLLRYTGLNLFKLCRYLKEELMIILATCSSEAVLPRMVDKMTNLGAARPVVGLTLPAGYSFNLDGTAIYLTMSSLFLAQALDIHMSLGEQLAMLGIMMITSKGAAGVPGGAFVVLAGSVSIIGHVPMAALALIVGIDRFLNEGRILTTVLGNAVATIFIAKWEGAFDLERAKAVLDGKDVPPLAPDEHEQSATHLPATAPAAAG
ncbi:MULTISPECIES: C4-dicarboxylate transporter DctA [Streptomyces]|uniref:C4-dicarboxylate transporter DctA n=1 Tax=Streptomyces lonegramiae TaxID=3075524 RepID=A0ABU2X7J6_9ACTN|nr:C4-dicarboxylate transporter DctA [Streptomyces sp. DSM 41529]MDT0541797.1 C4-dicarboxylate transporter DctA [Streptomyces sp. DSM 41529]